MAVASQFRGRTLPWLAGVGLLASLVAIGACSDDETSAASTGGGSGPGGSATGATSGSGPGGGTGEGVCGNELVDGAEDCDPPGSVCLTSGSCGEDCLCPPADDRGDIAVGEPAPSIQVTESATSVVAETDEYVLEVEWSGCRVDYLVRPSFTTNYLRYQRIHPQNDWPGTIDANGASLDDVCSAITDYSRDGSSLTFVESMAGGELAIRHTFRLLRDYLELDATYVPGTTKALARYIVALFDQNDELISLGPDHHYAPGQREDTPESNVLGGHYPGFLLFAPAIDVRVGDGDLGFEWGFDDVAATISSPQWIDPADYGDNGGADVFALSLGPRNSVYPEGSFDLGFIPNEEHTWHMFVRPYRYADGEPAGHDVGYAQWIAPRIAAAWGHPAQPLFPLTMMSLDQPPADFEAWIEQSQLAVATYSANADQVNWNYKSARTCHVAGSATVPDDWQLISSSGEPFLLGDGAPYCTAVSGPYTVQDTFRWHLIEDDPANDWWWGTRGVFWDETNTWWSIEQVAGDDWYNRPRNDYRPRDENINEGYLALVRESRDSGHWEYAFANPYTAQLHLALVADLTVVEGYLPSSLIGVDFHDHVVSTMKLVNSFPAELRPKILVYQYYDSTDANDRELLYHVLFDAVRYRFHVDLNDWNGNWTTKLGDYQLAEAMFVAMGYGRCDETRDQHVATLDASESSSLSTAAGMVVLLGAASAEPATEITFTSARDRYTLTNLDGEDAPLRLRLPSTASFAPGSDDIVIDAESIEGAERVLEGTILAGKTAFVAQQ